MKKDLTGIILAGGNNSCMGTNKAFIEIDGIRLIDNILSVYQKIFSEIIIVTDNPLPYTKFPGAIVVTAIYKNKDALGGVYTGLFYATNDYSFVADCDMHFLNEDFIIYLIGEAGKHDIIVPVLSDGFQPLHAIYSKNCLSHIKKLLIADKLKITGFYKEVRQLGISEEKIKPFNKDGRLFLNINTPRYLEKEK
jgi:molybdopterin-guanine dinucleotide biosynthesis protein A